MTSETLYEFLYEWTHRVVNIINEHNGPDYEIIKSHEPAPTPNSNNEDIDEDGFVDNVDPNKKPDPYIAIGYTGILERFGTASKSQRTDNDGYIIMSNDFDKTIEFREVNGGGDLLQMLIDTRESQEIRDFFKENYISYRSEGQIIPIPNITDNDYTLESIVEIKIGFATGGRYKVGYFEDVPISGTVNRPGGLESKSINI
jgi:hypothetical protein